MDHSKWKKLITDIV